MDPLDLGKQQRTAGENYAIFDPRECGILNVFLSLFPDAPAPAMRCTASLRESVDSSWQAKFAMWMMALLFAIARGLAMAGRFLELWLNTVHVNGGILKMIIKIVTGAGLSVPVQDSEDYWSFIGLLDPRTDLLLQQSCDEFRDHSSVFASENPASKLMADACMMTSKLAYENSQIIRKIVTENWKMSVGDISECINKYQPSNPTRFMIITDRAENAQAIILAFQGTELFNAYDWSACFDFSWYELPGIGRVHVGCLEALSLVDRQDMATFTRLRKNLAEKLGNVNTPRKADENSGFLRDQSSREDGSGTSEFFDTKEGNEHEDEEIAETVEDSAKKEPLTDFKADEAKKQRPFLSGLLEAASVENRNLLAYDAACHRLKQLVAAHKDAKVFVTGHSLGGAIATLFTSFLFHSTETQVTSRLAGVYTFGQPKVGDREFAADMTVNLNHPENRFFRVVYSNDLVARLPYADLAFQFKHLGPCFFYSSSYEGETVEDQPATKNLSSASLLPNHAVATWELLQSLLLRYKFGDAYKETLASTVFRLFGLLFPGIAAHSPVNYVNAIRLGPEILDAEVMPSALETRVLED